MILADLSHRRRDRAFTLIELLIIVLIIAIVTYMALPFFRKSAESSRSDQAVSSVQMIGAANKLYFLDHGMYADISKSKSGAPTLNVCAAAGTCDCNLSDPSNNCGDPCTLIWCGYIPAANLSSNYYNLYATDPGSNCGTGFATRMTSGPTGTSDVPYSQWGACADSMGRVSQFDSSGKCPLSGAACTTH